MSSEPSVPPHSLSRDIAIPGGAGERVSNQHRIYHPVSAGSTTPSSPTLLVQGQQLPETAEIKLLPDQNLTIEVPRRILRYQEICSLIQAAALMVSDANTAKEKELYRKAFRKGLAAAASICKLPQHSLANIDAVKGQPGFSEMMQEVLEDSEESEQSEEDVLWEIPPYTELSSYLTHIGRNTCRLLGRLDGMDVTVCAIGRIETHEYDDDYYGFFGKCVVQLGDLRMHAYCIGSILYTGTAILMAEDDRVFVYTPSRAVDRPWVAMNSSIGATIVFGHNGDITLEHHPELEVESLAEW